MRRIVFTLTAMYFFAATAYDEGRRAHVGNELSAALYGGGGCSHNYGATAAVGSSYCNCSTDDIRVKDDGGSFSTDWTNCGTKSSCQYPKNGSSCNGSG